MVTSIVLQTYNSEQQFVVCRVKFSRGCAKIYHPIDWNGRHQNLNNTEARGHQLIKNTPML